MKRFPLLALLATALIVLAAPTNAWSQYGGGGRYRSTYRPYPYLVPVPPERPMVEVGIFDSEGFTPSTLSVVPGTTVRWVNRGRGSHTVTSRDRLFDSGTISPGGAYSATFLQPGTYYYVCRAHEKAGMVGKVVVLGAGMPAPGYGPGR